MCAVDRSSEVIEIAKRAIYSQKTSDLVGESIFERMTTDELREMFDWKDNEAQVKSWVREGIKWHIGDACDPALRHVFGLQDIVVASNFLCHMDPPDAEKCLRNIATLLDEGAYIFVSGIDLEVRAKVAGELGWQPVLELIEEIHDGDPSIREDWPWKWWALEPIDKRRPDWMMRYAAVFRNANAPRG